MSKFYDMCYNGNIKKVNLMIKKDIKNLDWNRGLANACWGGHLDLVNLMIDQGANDWDWGLGAACWGKHLDLVKLMIDRGAQNWERGLYYACLGRNHKIIELMIEKGARNFEKCHCKECCGEDYEVLKLMIKYGFIPNKNRNYWDIKCIYLCLNKGYDINFQHIDYLIREQDPLIHLVGTHSENYLKKIREYY